MPTELVLIKFAECPASAATQKKFHYAVSGRSLSKYARTVCGAQRLFASKERNPLCSL
jgi:hypothetical protein